MRGRETSARRELSPNLSLEERSLRAAGNVASSGACGPGPRVRGEALRTLGSPRRLCDFGVERRWRRKHPHKNKATARVLTLQMQIAIVGVGDCGANRDGARGSCTFVLLHLEAREVCNVPHYSAEDSMSAAILASNSAGPSLRLQVGRAAPLASPVRTAGIAADARRAGRV